MSIHKQGVELSRFSIIPRTLVFVFNRDDVLLIKGAPQKKLWAGRYNGIGGHIEKGEDILSSAYRELKEESGITDIDLRLCGIVMINTSGDRGIGVFIFRGETEERIVTPSPEGVLYWVPTNKVLEFPLVEDLIYLLPKVKAHLDSEPPFSALHEFDKNGRLIIHFG